MRIHPWPLLPSLGLALALVLPAGCSSIPATPASVRPPLRIGVVADSPPLIFRQEGRWLGVEADLGRALASHLGLAPVWVAMPRRNLLNALLDGKVDLLMAGSPISEESRVHVDFTSPYLVVGLTALARAGEITSYNTEIKIRSARCRIGVIANSSGDHVVSRYFEEATRITFVQPEVAATALIQNQIDLFIHDAPAAWWLGLRHPRQLAIAPVLFAREEIAWAFRRGSVALRESANEALEIWQQDGTLESILQRWIPFSK